MKGNKFILKNEIKRKIFVNKIFIFICFVLYKIDILNIIYTYGKKNLFSE